LLLATLTALPLPLAVPATAGPLELAVEVLPGDNALPDCDDPSVIADVQDRFAYGAANMLQAELVLTDIDRIRQTYPTIIKPSPVARRY
ncbi:hypothetical protein, partial [Mycobacterium tuberculosis]|uniref:hypothetical protein n=1 Tax=Mycobacterium tuberculosis TaxID=1773 RepID=UPI001AE61040